jgi:hypothetical protein
MEQNEVALRHEAASTLKRGRNESSVCRSGLSTYLLALNLISNVVSMKPLPESLGDKL